MYKSCQTAQNLLEYSMLWKWVFVFNEHIDDNVVLYYKLECLDSVCCYKSELPLTSNISFPNVYLYCIVNSIKKNGLSGDLTNLTIKSKPLLQEPINQTTSTDLTGSTVESEPRPQTIAELLASGKCIGYMHRGKFHPIDFKLNINQEEDQPSGLNNPLFQALCKISDTRYRNRQYSFKTLMFTTICSMFAGYNSFTEMEAFASAHKKEFEKYCPMPYGIPSHDTYCRVVKSLDYESLLYSTRDVSHLIQNVYNQHNEKDADLNATYTIIAIDGKIIRNSKNGQHLDVLVITAFDAINQCVINQIVVDRKTNEHKKLSELIRSLKDDELLKGNVVITIDAAGSYNDICNEIIDADYNFVIPVKLNQKTLMQEINNIFSNSEYCTEIYKDKDNRGVIRETVVFNDATVLSNLMKRYSEDKATRAKKGTSEEDWSMVKSIIKETYTATIKKNGKKQRREFTRYFISSQSISARECAFIIRKHWNIENVLHWSLDVMAKEDKACIRDETTVLNMNLLRKIVLACITKLKAMLHISANQLKIQYSASIDNLLIHLDELFMQEGNDFFIKGGIA